MAKRVIRSDQGAPPLGAYSQGWQAGGFVFVTGTGPIGPDGKVKGDTIEEQTNVTIDNIEAVLAAAGATLADVVKVSVHLGDTGTFPRYNEVYQRRFHEPYLARTTVGSDLRQVPGMLIEIEVSPTSASDGRLTCPPHPRPPSRTPWRQRMSRFEGRTALVTGAAQGIGRGVAERLASEGARLVLLDIEPEALERTVRELRAKDEPGRGRQRRRRRASRRPARGRARRRALRRPGRPGGHRRHHRVLVRARAGRRVLAAHPRRQPHRIHRHPGGRPGHGGARRRRDRADGVDERVLPGGAHRALLDLQAGLVGFVRAASLDLGQHGIRINAVNPGIINTRLSKVLIDDPIGGPEYLRRILAPLGEPADIAAVVAFLASDDAGCMTGEDVTADAGATVGVVLEVEDIGLGEHGPGRADRDG